MAKKIIQIFERVRQSFNMNTETQQESQTNSNEGTGMNNDAEAKLNSMLAQAANSSQTAMMMVDTDLKITYLNPSTLTLLKSLEPTMKSLWPDFEASEEYMMGKCIDDFHRNPAHQRKILSDPNNLPYQTNINLGDKTINLNVAAVLDSHGTHQGSSLEWSDVTEQVKSNNDVARMLGAMEGSGTATMMVDRDMIVTYLNPSTYKLLESLSSTLKSIWPDFEPTEKHMLGKCIDDFHRNPAHQRKILDDPANLPYQTDIRLGDKTVRLNVAAILDSEDKYVGSSLEWSDITEIKQKEILNNDYAGQIDAISKAQAVIEFNMDGTIITANENFLSTVGYSLDEVVGKHHSIFVEPEFKSSAEYREFWEKLNRGEYEAKEYKRIGKGGKEVWIQASYNPIMDLDGKPFKIVKYATDITAQMLAMAQIDQLVQGATRGELDERIDNSNSQGFVASLGEGINTMLDKIVTPINSCKEVLSEMANGNLQESMEGEYFGTFKELQTAVNTTIENLRNMVGEIMESSSHVSTSSREISQGNTDLSQRTEEQASSLEETASSMEELTATVKENSEAATKANKLSATTMQQAESGGKVVEDAVVAMKEINNASREISDIIGVIDEIAFQTNLLALNAAVEAARAGDQGRGFAVVAAEVRNLAQRSASAAKDIKSLISNSVDKVNQGTELVNDSGQKLSEIVESVRNVSGLVSEIANASEEQANGIEEVNQAVTQMDNMTQQNSALVEEAAAAAEALTEQAGNMLELMSFFKTGDESGVKNSKIVSPVINKADKSKAPVVEDDWEEF